MRCKLLVIDAILTAKGFAMNDGWKDMKVGAIIRSVLKDKYFAVLIIDGAVFQCLEVYQGDDGLSYWKQRFDAVGLPYTIEK